MRSGAYLAVIIAWVTLIGLKLDNASDLLMVISCVGLALTLGVAVLALNLNDLVKAIREGKVRG